MNRILSIALCAFISALPFLCNAHMQAKDINASDDSSSPYFFYPLNSKFLFCANDSIHNHQLYVPDGTNAGTVIPSIIPYITHESSSAPSVKSAIKKGGFNAHNNNYYFLVIRTNFITENYIKICKTDGAVSGTMQADKLPRNII